MQPRNAEQVRFGVTLSVLRDDSGTLSVGQSFDASRFMDWPEQRAAVDKFLRLARREILHGLKQHRKRRAP